MYQGDLFHQPPLGAAKARREDPVTSKDAARQVERSGRAGRQRDEVEAVVRMYPGRTAGEIAEIAGMERHVPSRRLPELADLQLVERGPVRKCTVLGTNGLTWWPKGWQEQGRATA